MDIPPRQCLMEYLRNVPDPRKARGKQFEWPDLMVIIGAALVSGQKSVRAIAHWAMLHTQELLAHPALALRRIPSASTLFRVLQRVDLAALEAQIAAYGQAVADADPASGRIIGPTGEVLQGQAVDGKTLRGASAHGEPVTVVNLVRHGSGVVLAQAPVPSQTNEIPVVQDLLAGRDLTGSVTTLDALHTQRQTAQQIVARGGDYVMFVKANQPELWKAIDLLFQTPPLRGEDDRLLVTTTGKAHGRLETRTVTSTSALGDYLAWPAAAQVFRRECRRESLRSGKVSEQTTYGIASLSRARALPHHLESLCRGHWTIEDRVYYVRDETLGEDRCQVHRGSAAQALAILRNAILNLFRWAGWENIAAAVRHFGSSPNKALALIGAGAT